MSTDKLKILEMIQEGKISTAAGLELLQALDMTNKGWQIPGFWLALVTGVIIGLCNSVAKRLHRYSPI